MAPLFFVLTKNVFRYSHSALKIAAMQLFVGAFVGNTFKVYLHGDSKLEIEALVAALQMFQRWWREMVLVM